MKIKIQLLAVFLISSAFAGTTSVDNGSKDIPPEGTTHFAIMDHSKSIDITITTKKVTIDSRKNYGLSPATNSISEIKISIGADSLFVPRSAYCDLTDLHEVSLNKNRNYVLAISGGDASEGYHASIVFDSSDVLKRSVMNGESGVVVEETAYHKIPASTFDR